MSNVEESAIKELTTGDLRKAAMMLPDSWLELCKRYKTAVDFIGDSRTPKNEIYLILCKKGLISFNESLIELEGKVNQIKELKNS